MSVLSSLDFVLSFCREKIPGNGEDCYCYSFTDDAGLLGVFDGCGGAGAREHAYYSGHTEAFMASRLCAGAFYDCFRNNPPEQLVPERFAAEQLAPVTALAGIAVCDAVEAVCGIRPGLYIFGMALIR